MKVILPLPLVGEGGGEGAIGFPLTLFLPPAGERRSLGTLTQSLLTQITDTDTVTVALFFR